MIGTRLLDRYELTGELGRGGMGVVYRAHDPVLGREVAIKMIPPGRLEGETEQRFQREARLVAKMDHPGIVPIHDLGSHEGSLFFVMPWVRGALLRTLLDGDTPPDLSTVVEIGIQVAEALDYSHALGVVHRDIKPENIMVSGDGEDLRVRVMDFGLAMGATEARLTQTGSLIGSVHAIAPELISKGESDSRSDLYSLGVVLYECIVGEPPFTGPIHQVLGRIVNEPASSLRDRGVVVPPELEEVILSCLAKNPADRPQRGRELAALLSAGLIDLGGDFLQRSQEEPMNLPGAYGSAALPKSRLVGRDAEISELGRRLSAAMNGECRLVLIGGELGTGKTALLEELVRQAKSRQALVLRGRFASDRLDALPFQGFCEIIQDGFRLRDASEGSGVIDRAVPQMADLAAPLAARFPTLSEIPEIRRAVQETEKQAAEKQASEHESPRIDTTPEMQSAEVFELLARTLIRLGGGRPLVLLIENLHSADISVEALQYIIHRIGPTPTLVVCTYRSEEVDRSHPIESLRSAFLEDPRFSSILLGPLTGEDYRNLVQSFLNDQEDEKGIPDDELVRRLDDVAEGNPYFTSELLHSLRRTAGLRCEEGVWRLSEVAGVSLETLPATIQQAIERRCESLTPPQRVVLRHAAVLGRRFEYEDLEEMISSADADLDGLDLDDVVDSLIHEEMLVEDNSTRSDLLMFAGGALRDVLYREMSRRRRRGLHRRHAYALEKRWKGRLDRIYLRLVRHFSEGDVADKTVEYAHLAACDALEKQSPEDALRLLREALEWIEEEDIPDAPKVRAELHYLSARACRSLGHHDRALREVERAAQSFAKLGLQERAARCALLAAQIAWHARWTDVSRKWVARAIEESRAVEEKGLLEAALQLAATLANLRGELAEGRALLEEVEALRAEMRPSTEEDVVFGGTLYAALSQPVRCLDPARVETDQEDEVCANLYDTLLRFDGEGHLASELCAGWERGGDSRLFTLQLRDDVYFSDGTRLTARLAKESLQRAAFLDKEPAPLFPVLEGWDEARSGGAAGGEISGIQAEGDRLHFRLREPLPIFPVLLCDYKTAVVHEKDGELFGTGPFSLADPSLVRRVAEQREITMVRNPSAASSRSPRVENLVLLSDMNPDDIAQGLERGTIDLGRDLLPHDLEAVLRHPQLRGGLVEATKKNSFYALLNLRGPMTRIPELRRALIGCVRVRELVWRTLGRFAQPAVGLIPPGVLGYDAGRRPTFLTAGSTRELLRQAGLTAPLRLQAAIHPILQSRYEQLTAALLGEWSALGIEVVNLTPDLESYFQKRGDSFGVDLILGRWNADFNDPETFTRSLFHSETGIYREYFSSEEVDEWFDRARQEESATARQTLYQRFETHLLDVEYAALPLFHDIDYRIAGPRLRGVELSSTLPYVNYAGIGKTTEVEPLRSLPRSSLEEIHIPLTGPVRTLDPIGEEYAEHSEVVSTIFEPLLRIAEDTRIIPWLARSIESSEGGRVYRLLLRQDVRFHDGRRFTARDVRFTFERMLKRGTTRLGALLRPIRGSSALRSGEADELVGLRILNEYEVRIELDEPLALFPSLLAHPGAGILPESIAEDVAEEPTTFLGSWRDGCVGTGPFRVLHFHPGRLLELESHPDYWQPRLPKSERLTFHLGLTSQEISERFRAGEFSLASGLRPADVEALRQETHLYDEYLEAPRLATCFLALNSASGPLADLGIRRALRDALDVDAAVRTLGHLGQRARGFLPPGLLGVANNVGETLVGSDERRSLQGLRLRTFALPVFLGPYEKFWNSLVGMLTSLGVELEFVQGSAAEQIQHVHRGEVDLAALRWIADYPDADSFVTGVFHRGTGSLTRLCATEQPARLADEGRREASIERRHEIYRELEQVVAREVLLIPLFYEQTYRLTAPTARPPGVHGCRLGFAVPEIRYEELEPSGSMGSGSGR